MKRWVVLSCMLVCAGSAYANPVVFDPVGLLPFLLVIVSAFTVEVGVVTLILLFWGTETKPIFFALFFGNALIYFVVFLPLFDALSSLWIAEAVVVLLDGLLIKLLTRYDSFRQETFRPIKWPYIFVISGIGNIVSYYVGVATG